MELQPDATPAPVPSDNRDWSELPVVALTSVLAGLGAVDVLMGAGLVCHSWLEAAKTPELWREVEMGRWPRDNKVMDMDGDIDLDLSSQGFAFASRILPRQPQDQDHYSGENREVMCAMAKVAVDRSEGQLEAFVGAHFITDEILNYIWARSPNLRRLALVSCEVVSCDGFTDLVNMCPLLEDLEVSGCKHVCGHAMVAAGRACPRLVLNKPWRRRWDRWDAAGISMMRELRHLRISRSEIRNEELMAVVDGCPFLEHLSVAECPNIVVDDALRAKCAAVKTLDLPTSQDLDDLDAYEYGSLSYYVHVDNDWMSDPGWMA